MEIKLNKAYSSHWDNVQYPIFKLSDESYLCISFSRNHGVYCINTYTKEDFIEQGFEEDEYFDDYFENLTKDSIML